MDVVVRERAAVLQLLASEDEALLIRRDSFFVLDLLAEVTAARVLNCLPSDDYTKGLIHVA